MSWSVGLAVEHRQRDVMATNLPDSRNVAHAKSVGEMLTLLTTQVGQQSSGIATKGGNSFFDSSLGLLRRRREHINFALRRVRTRDSLLELSQVAHLRFEF